MSLVALSISLVLTFAAVVAVGVKYLWLPQRQGNQLRDLLLRAGVQARPLPQTSIWAAEFPLREWTFSGDADQVKQRLREMAAKTSGLTVSVGQTGDLLLSKSAAGSVHADSTRDLLFSQAQLAFEVGPRAEVRILCRLRTRLVRELAWVLGIVFFMAGYFMLLGLRSDAWRPYLPAVCVALAGSFGSYALARGPGQRLLLERFLDTLILESARPT